ncbi:hypothetical protein P8864_20375 [Priestia flexa]|uniref:hypothetical protein n=1 Tax=Priestia flexa TaxID=86664 RepID=UPI002DB64378|nr:hypothetical protein [Priestia flexa]MEC0668212.1 hypothetical protein [Priestia flexa]
MEWSVGHSTPAGKRGKTEIPQRNGTNVLRQIKEMGTASVRLLEAIILLCPKLFFIFCNFIM